MSIFNPIYETKKRLGLLGKKKYRRKSYHNFLKTKRWQKIRNRVYKRGVCEMCGATSNFNVHHKTYYRLGDSLDQDLQLLCRDCHKKVHNIKPWTGKETCCSRIRLNTA